MMAHSRIVRRLLVAAASIVAVTATAGVIACSSSSSAPLGPVVVTPNSLTFTCALTPMTFSVSQQNFAGTFTAVSNDVTVVTVAPTSPPDTFAVTPQAGAGNSTTITVTGGVSMTATVTATQATCFCVRHHDMWGKTRKP